MKLRFLTNTKKVKSFSDFTANFGIKDGCDMYEQYETHVQWLSDKIIGKPQPTDWLSTERLMQQGLVGVYAIEEEDDDE